MNELLQSDILEKTLGFPILKTEQIQNLWGGYGKILRLSYEKENTKTIIVKHIKLPQIANHSKGWVSKIAHERKVKSYEVEKYFYENYSKRCEERSRVPFFFGALKQDDEILLLLEDLDFSGFPVRKTSLAISEIKSCIKWLANFHVTFLDESLNGLWQKGSYWHLETRPEELEALTDIRLKNLAPKIDAILNECEYKTLLHGDAKLANFCFSHSGEVAALDFQYTGKGCAMKDLAYFMSSAFGESDLAKYEEEILGQYFSELKKFFPAKSLMFRNLEREWRYLYPIAYTDFYRFLKGWSPGYYKLNSYSEKLAKKVIGEIEKL